MRRPETGSRSTIVLRVSATRWLSAASTLRCAVDALTKVHAVRLSNDSHSCNEPILGVPVLSLHCGSFHRDVIECTREPTHWCSHVSARECRRIFTRLSEGCRARPLSSAARTSKLRMSRHTRREIETRNAEHQRSINRNDEQSGRR